MKNNRNKLGRNDACHCGSGNKYKRCCLSSDTMRPQGESIPNKSMQLKSAGRLKNRVQQNLGDNFSVYQGDIDGIKMSAVILDVADFLFEATHTGKQIQAAAAMACIAWNIAVIGFEEAQTILGNYFEEKNDPVHEQDMLEIVHAVVERKEMLYPELNRIILDYELAGTKDNFHLNVVSTMPEESAPKLKQEQMATLLDKNHNAPDLLEAIGE